MAVPWAQAEGQTDDAVSQDFAPVVVVPAGQLASVQEVDLDQLDINDIGEGMDANENENENDNDNGNDNTSGLPGDFEGLIRVVQVVDFILQNDAGEDLGEVEESGDRS